MKKYIVETLTVVRQIHVVEAENESDAYKIASVADDNWQEYLGELKVDCQEYTEEHIKRFKEKSYFSDVVSYWDKNNPEGVSYRRVGFDI